jgi:hypothetical protein
MNTAAYKALVLLMWHFLAPGAERLANAPRIADAIVAAVQADAAAAPVYGSHAEDAAVMAYFAVRESWLNPGAVGDGNRSFGVWQMRGACAHVSVEAQARCWLAQLHASPCKGGHAVETFWGTCGHPAYSALAARREARAHEVLVQAVGAGQAEAQGGGR